METLINEFVSFISSIGIIGGILSCFLILIESMLPVLPLFAFITINFIAFGNVLGFIISWVFTVLGCILSYLLFRNGFSDKFNYLIRDKEKLKKYKNMLKNITLPQLIIIIAIPFTPAFLINIVCGLLKVDFKKFFIALLIGKISLVYYSGFIGKSLLESINNPLILIKIAFVVFITYIISKIVTKIFKIKE